MYEILRSKWVLYVEYNLTNPQSQDLGTNFIRCSLDAVVVAVAVAVAVAVVVVVEVIVVVVYTCYILSAVSDENVLLKYSCEIDELLSMTRGYNMYMFWFNFILGLNFIFLCFWLW